MINGKDVDLYIASKRYKQINSILLWQKGNIVLENYYNNFNEESRNVIRSVAKSILSICTGICLDKGLIRSLDETICRYLPQFDKGIDPMHRAITIKHLLTMTSGIYWVGGVHYHCPQLAALRRSSDWVSHIADTAMKDVPGTKYNYKEYDMILLTAVLEAAIGGDIFDFINENLYLPLGIKSGRWWKSSCGITYSCAEAGAGNGGKDERTSNLRTRDMMKIGQLFLQKGFYDGKQIVSKEYVEQAITPSRCNKGYGFLWWLGEDWFGCRGFGGQNITVVPGKNLIFVMQAVPTSRGKDYEDVFEFVNGLV